MKPAAPRPTLAAVILAVGMIGAAETSTALDELARVFPNEASIRVQADGLARLPLPPEIVAACRPDLSDLRVFDANGREVAYLVDSGRADPVGASEYFEGKVLGVSREEEGHLLEPGSTQEVYEIEAPARSPEVGTWELVVTTAAPRFVRQISVARIGSDAAAEALVERAPLFALDPNTRLTRVPLPELRSDRLVVTIEGQEGFYLEPSFAFASSRELAPLHQVVVPLEIRGIEQEAGTTRVELARPSGIVPDAIDFETATGSFRRPVTVFDVQPGRSDVKLGSGTLFRVDTASEIDQRRIHLLPARGATLRVEIADGDSPALADLEVVAVVRQPVLLFDLGGGRSGTLRFGGGRAHLARYDLAELAARSLPQHGDAARAAAQLYDPAALIAAELGAIRPNPAFDTTPALAFAMRPGADIDVRRYTKRRSLHIEPSIEGLSRLQLEPSDMAAARADLADVRIVDSQFQQWPYLLESRAVERWVPLRVARSSRDNGTSTYRLELPFAPLPIGGIRFDANAPYFHRSYELLALDEDGDARRLAKGDLAKDARRPRPTSISFGARRLHGIELRVDDGDDAPLHLRDVSARMQLPELFLVAPAGEYSLLVGNPGADPPSYELERVRRVVLAVASNPVVMGPLDANPSYRATAGLGADSPLLQRSVVWAVILAAALILGWLTLRLARQGAGPDERAG